MPILRFDLFRVGSKGKLLWLGPVADIDHARSLVRRLPPSPNGYCIIDQESGKRIEVKADEESEV